ncbi:hypothetical protein [Brevibacterium zhoupengii]|uniref:hypothetical protein n=1 Tax=Brevibacterium zhoupengii TaxID=2898795 RepID=UPI001F0983CC|nr:hypothetical protein [Brevibacterium zhoupengii]
MMTTRIRSKVAVVALALATSATLFSASPAAASPTYGWGISVPGAKSKCLSATNKKIHEIRTDGGSIVKSSICKFALGKNPATGKPIIYHSTNLSWKPRY